MEKKVFLNCTAHNLTAAQKEKAKERFQVDKFINLKEINPELFNKLSSMKLEDDVEDLCYKLFEFINNYTHFYNIVYVHMPCGSPYFMAYFFYDFLNRVNFNGTVKFIFSFSERKVVEKNINGKIEKKSIFQFIDYQILN